MVNITPWYTNASAVHHYSSTSKLADKQDKFHDSPLEATANFF
jgi:hypothetical protein